MESPTRIWQVTLSDRTKAGAQHAKYAVLLGLSQTAADASHKAYKAAPEVAHMTSIGMGPRMEKWKLEVNL